MLKIRFDKKNDMDIVTFVEEYLGIELLQYQKEYLKWLLNQGTKQKLNFIGEIMDNAILQHMVKTEIGIFFEDTQWRDRIFEKLVKDATKCSSIKYINQNEICFSDMFIYIRIRFCSANESARGHKFNRIYYQYGINEDTLSMLINPMLMTGIFPLEMIEADVTAKPVMRKAGIR